MGGYFLRGQLLVVYPFELIVMTKKQKDPAGLVRVAYYSRHSDQRVTTKWAEKNPQLVWKVTFYGKVALEFLKRGQMLPSNYNQALKAYITQMKAAGVLDIPHYHCYYSLRTGKRITERAAKRMGAAAESLSTPTDYGYPKNRKEALEFQTRSNYAIEDMLRAHALKEFKAGVKKDLAEATKSTGNEQLLAFAKPLEKPKNNMDEFLKHGRKKAVDTVVENFVKRKGTRA